MNVYLGDVEPRKDKDSMTEDEFWDALAATKDRYGWRVEWYKFNEHWHIRARNGDTFCPITAVAMHKLDSFYEPCEWDNAISSTTGINLPYDFAYKVVNAADGDPDADPKFRARILEVLELTQEDKDNREGGPPEENKIQTPSFP